MRAGPRVKTTVKRESTEEIKDQLRTKYQRKAKDQSVINTQLEAKDTVAQIKVQPENTVVEAKEQDTVEKIKDQPGVEDIEDTVWKRDLRAITEMRKNKDAAVDTMGCHMLHDKDALPEVQRFQILLALMLSSQTKDEVTSAAMQRLRTHGCTIDNIISTTQSELEDLLKPVGFYRRKAEYIKKAAVVLKDEYKGDIPSTLEGLCELTGVGPKMAHLVMQTAWDQTLGIAVDTHVHRIVNRLGWAHTSTPEQTRAKLEGLLPREEWSRVNKLLVGFGQQRCLPVKPKCSECLLRTTCPSSTSKKDKKNKDDL